MKQVWRLTLLMWCTACFCAWFAPRTQASIDQRAAVPLERLFPAQFAGWSLDPMAATLVRPAFDRARQFQMYDQVLERTYVHRDGYRIMLSVAYGRRQSVGLQMHRPEVCYKAGGFRVTDVADGTLALPSRSLPVTRLFASMDGRPEPITYWRLMGDEAVRDEWSYRWQHWLHGQRGTPDGMLVRVSSIDPDRANAYRRQAGFVADLAAHLDQMQAKRVLGH